MEMRSIFNYSCFIVDILSRDHLSLKYSQASLLN